MSVIYEHFNPSSRLSPYIVRYTSVTHQSENKLESPLQKCLPTGMAELIFQADANQAFGFTNNVQAKFPRVYLVGIMQEPVLWKLPDNAALFTIRITPEGLIRLFNIPIAEFVNTFVDGEELFKGAHLSFIKSILEARTTLERIYQAETFLLTRLYEKTNRTDYFEEALRLIRNCGGRVLLNKLNESLYVSNRQLERKFKEFLGLSPKSYQRIVRFNDVYNYLHTRQEVNWQDISYNFGYSDQAHFIRDFKKFSGSTPTDFAKWMNR